MIFFIVYFMNLAVIIVWPQVITVLYFIIYDIVSFNPMTTFAFHKQNICYIMVTMYEEDCLHGGGPGYKSSEASTRFKIIWVVFSDKKERLV